MQFFASDVRYFEGRKGTGLRCAVTMQEGDLAWTIEGCLVFRDKTGKVNFLPPSVPIRKQGSGQVIRYRNNKVTPKLQKLLDECFEKNYGKIIGRGNSVAEFGKHPGQVEAGLGDGFEVSLG